jgi:hypothetical protein
MVASSDFGFYLEDLSVPKRRYSNVSIRNKMLIFKQSRNTGTHITGPITGRDKFKAGVDFLLHQSCQDKKQTVERSQDFQGELNSGQRYARVVGGRLWQISSACFVRTGALGRGQINLSRQTVARSAHRFNHEAGLRPERFTQSFDMYIHCAFLNKYMIPPNPVKQFRACMYTLGMRHQIVQQLEFSGPEFEHLFVKRHTIGFCIQ